MPLDGVDETLQMGGEVTDIPMKLSEWKNIDKEVERVSSLLGPEYSQLVVQSYIDLFGGGEIMESKRSVISLMLFLVFMASVTFMICPLFNPSCLNTVYFL